MLFLRLHAKKKGVMYVIQINELNVFRVENFEKGMIYMKILKKRGSREKGGGGNEIHAPCACDFLARHLPNCPCSNFSLYVDLFQEISPRIARQLRF
jgi:hypothetical protein